MKELFVPRAHNIAVCDQSDSWDMHISVVLESAEQNIGITSVCQLMNKKILEVKIPRHPTHNTMTHKAPIIRIYQKHMNNKIYCILNYSFCIENMYVFV